MEHYLPSPAHRRGQGVHHTGVRPPIIYGVNLPLKYPFYAGMIAGGVGGAFIGAGRSGAEALVFPSAMSLPAMLNVGNPVLLLIGTGVSAVLGFVGTWFVVPMAERKLSAAAALATPDNPVAAPEPTAQPGSNVVDFPHTQDVPGQLTVLAPMSGTVVPLEDVDDKVFASGAMGAGIGIEPTFPSEPGVEKLIVTSPVTGTLIAVQKTGHAYGIRGDNGAEVLVHVGIDTVKMGGEGFSTLVERGQHVTAGDSLGTVDLGAVKDAGYPATTLVIVTNSRKLTTVTPVETGAVTEGATILDIEK